MQIICAPVGSSKCTISWARVWGVRRCLTPLGPPHSLLSRLPLWLGPKAPGATGTGSRGRTELQLHQEGKCSRSWL